MGVTVEFLIKSFRNAGLERFFRTGSKRGIQPAHASKLRLLLGVLDQASKPEDMNLPGWDWHPLQGEFKGHWAVKVNANWRVTFSFEGTDAILTDYLDYH